MRFVVVASLAVLGLAQSAVAADLGPYLHGGQYEEPAAPYRWSGVYGGGQVGYSVAGVEDPGTDVSALVNSGLSLPPFDSPPFPGNAPTAGWTLAGKRNPVGISYGAFVGYNL
jgi:opacity protein-like surface antigen